MNIQRAAIPLVSFAVACGCRTERVSPAQPETLLLPGSAQASHQAGSSKEWLVGRWEWRLKSKTAGMHIPTLESLSGFRVYPYMDFDAPSVRIGEAYIPAEFIVRDSNGTEEVLDSAVPVLMKADSFFAGQLSGWLFSYQHWQTNGTHWMSLTLVPDHEHGSFSIVLEKESDDPGPPVDRTRLLLVHPYSDDPDKWEMEYRQRKGLNSTLQPYHPR
jgi:hypothetical protein